MQQFMDVHTHSSYSFDGVDSPGAMADRVQELGLAVWALTDHCEANDPDSAGCKTACTGSYDAIQELKASGRCRGVELLAGIELGQIMQNQAFALECLKAREYDFVIGSLHNSAGRKDFYYMNAQEARTDTALLVEEYYQEMLQMVRLNQLDVLGHLTYPLRYVVGEYKIPFDMAPYGDLIDEIFKTLIQNGKGIEINTSGLRQKLGLTLPHKPYLLRYRELGGEMITVGSDAHCVQDLGKGVGDAYELLRECGFSYVHYFKSRKPVAIKIR